MCTICSEQFDFDCLHDVSALHCGHIFHADCLTPWLNQSMTCPHCRQEVTRDTIVQKLYFSQPDSQPDADDSVVGEFKLHLSRVSKKLVKNLNLQESKMLKALDETRGKIKQLIKYV